MVFDIDDIPEDCKPESSADQHIALFNYTRFLKAYVNPTLFIDKLRLWSDRYSLNDSFQDIYDFESYLERVLVPYGCTLFDFINESADGYELGDSLSMHIKENSYRYDDRQIRLLKVCSLLSECGEGEVFYLSMSDAAKYIGLSDAASAGNRLKSLCREGVLEVVRKGERGLRGKATEYKLSVL